MENCSALWKVPPCIFDSLETVLPGMQWPIKGAKVTFRGSSLSKYLWKKYSLSRSYLFIVVNLKRNVSGVFPYKSFNAFSLIRCAKNPGITRGRVLKIQYPTASILGRYVTANNFQPIRIQDTGHYRVSPSVWLVENRSTVQRICCRWTLYPKINFQPIRTCSTHALFHGITYFIPLDMYRLA